MIGKQKIGEVQGIIRFLQDPCYAPWTLYLELAKEPGREVIIELLMFGLDDVIRGFIRPKGVYSFRRTGRRRGRKGGVRGIPEIGELIGHNLPGAETLSARRFGTGTRWLWLIDGVLQRFLWWFMVVDLLTEFVYKWTSLVAKTEYCHAGRLSGGASCDVAHAGLTPSEFPFPLGCDYLHKSWGQFQHMAPAIVTAPSSVYTASITVVALPHQSFGTLKVWIAPTGQPDNVIGKKTEVDQSFFTNDATAALATDLPGPGSYTAYASVSGPNMAFITGGILTGFAYF